jgi:hypothetical protein
MYTQIHRYTHNGMIYLHICVCMDDVHTNESMIQENACISFSMFDRNQLCL